MRDVDPGFEPGGLLAVQVQPPPYRYGSPEERVALYDALREAAEARPGVVSAALASHIPLGGRFDTFRFLVEGRPPPESVDLLVTQMRAVSPGYFGTMGTSVLRGRSFEEADRPGAERVAVVNRAMARQHWPGEEVLGQRVSLMGPDGPWIRVVGVVEDVRSFGATADVRPELFVPMAQEMWPRAELVVRAAAGTGTLAVLPAVRDAVAEVDPLLPLASARTFDALVDRDRAPWRFQAVLASVFGGVAAGLSVVGVVGLLGYVVQQRRRELAVRRALGAGRSDIRRLVGAGALRLGLAGAGLGLAAAALLSVALGGMLYGVAPLDPASYLAVGAVLVALTLLGAWLPARRAAAVEPSEALREG